MSFNCKGESAGGSWMMVSSDVRLKSFTSVDGTKYSVAGGCSQKGGYRGIRR